MSLHEFATQLGLSTKTIRRYMRMGYIDAEKVEDSRGFRYEISACELPKIRKLLARNIATLADHAPELALHVMQRRGQCDVQYSEVERWVKNKRARDMRRGSKILSSRLQ